MNPFRSINPNDAVYTVCQTYLQEVWNISMYPLVGNLIQFLVANAAARRKSARMGILGDGGFDMERYSKFLNGEQMKLLYELIQRDLIIYGFCIVRRVKTTGWGNRNKSERKGGILRERGGKRKRKDEDEDADVDTSSSSSSSDDTGSEGEGDSLEGDRMIDIASCTDTISVFSQNDETEISGEKYFPSTFAAQDNPRYRFTRVDPLSVTVSFNISATMQAQNVTVFRTGRGYLQDRSPIADTIVTFDPNALSSCFEIKGQDIHSPSPTDLDNGILGSMVYRCRSSFYAVAEALGAYAKVTRLEADPSWALTDSKGTVSSTKPLDELRQTMGSSFVSLPDAEDLAKRRSEFNRNLALEFHGVSQAIYLEHAKQRENIVRMLKTSAKGGGGWGGMFSGGSLPLAKSARDSKSYYRKDTFITDPPQYAGAPPYIAPENRQITGFPKPSTPSQVMDMIHFHECHMCLVFGLNRSFATGEISGNTSADQLTFQQLLQSKGVTDSIASAMRGLTVLLILATFQENLVADSILLGENMAAEILAKEQRRLARRLGKERATPVLVAEAEDYDVQDYRQVQGQEDDWEMEREGDTRRWRKHLKAVEKVRMKFSQKLFIDVVFTHINNADPEKLLKLYQMEVIDGETFQDLALSSLMITNPQKVQPRSISAQRKEEEAAQAAQAAAPKKTQEHQAPQNSDEDDDGDKDNRKPIDPAENAEREVDKEVESTGDTLKVKNKGPQPKRMRTQQPEMPERAPSKQLSAQKQRKKEMEGLRMSSTGS